MLSKDQRRNDRGWRRQTELASNEASQPRLGVQRAERCLCIAQDSLALDDQQQAGGRVPTDEVDAAALPVAAIADFRPRLPSPAAQTVCPRSLECSVVLIEQAIELRPAPACAHLDPHAERLDAPANRADREPIGAATLEMRNGRPIDARCGGKV